MFESFMLFFIGESYALYMLDDCMIKNQGKHLDSWFRDIAFIVSVEQHYFSKSQHIYLQ